MKIVDCHDRAISTLNEWREYFVKRTKKPVHWKKGRSAYSLADFILNRNGSDFLESRVSSVLSESVTFEWAMPEYKAKFDRYRNPSQLDLAIFGNIDSGKSLFVGVEAKVDEPFGPTVSKRYQAALKERCADVSTDVPERIKELLSGYFLDFDSPENSKYSGIRYQLLTAAAGTVSVPKDLVVLYILVFKTNSYDPHKGEENYSDYKKFVACTGGKPLTQPRQDVLAHELFFSKKRLIAIHEYVNFGN